MLEPGGGWMITNYEAEDFIALTALDILRRECTQEPRIWFSDKRAADRTASPTRHELFILHMERNDHFIDLTGDLFLYYSDIVDHKWFSHLLRSLASCYGLYCHRKEQLFKADPDCVEEFHNNLTGDFARTQESSLSGTDWSERIYTARNEDEFWKEASLTFIRYFKYAKENYKDLMQHSGKVVKPVILLSGYSPR
jgi:hypothetical protein